MPDHIIRNDADRRRLVAFLQGLELLDAYCAEHMGLLLPHPEDLMMAIYGERKAA